MYAVYVYTNGLIILRKLFYVNCLKWVNSFKTVKSAVYIKTTISKLKYWELHMMLLPSKNIQKQTTYFILFPEGL